MSEYIIKNCPCLFNSYYASGKTVRFECNDGNHDDKLCRDVTDCVMKQIVEKCKNTQFLSTKNRLDLYAVKVFANDLLQLLDIQEVE